MSSRIITPPDKFFTTNSYVILNARDREIDTLVLWLKTVPETYDVHLWHLYMPESELWLLQVMSKVHHVLVNREFLDNLSPLVKRKLDHINHSFFGQDSEHLEVIHYFLRNRP